MTTIKKLKEQVADELKDLIEEFKKMPQQQQCELISAQLKAGNFLLSSDEEWNTLYGEIEIEIDEESMRPVLFGATGNEFRQGFE